MGVNMRMLERNKRKINICHLYFDGNLKKYKEAITLYENYQVTTSDVDLISSGMNAYSYIRIKTSLDHAEYYHLGDRVYINNIVPIEHDVLCESADYEVCEPPVTTLNECEVVLKSLSDNYGY